MGGMNEGTLMILAAGTTLFWSTGWRWTYGKLAVGLIARGIRRTITAEIDLDLRPTASRPLDQASSASLIATAATILRTRFFL
jgi:hypothetical protein